MPWITIFSGWNMDRFSLTREFLVMFLAETVGTAALLFFACLGQLTWSPDVPIPPLQGPVASAAIVATVIEIFGHISGGQINPAVTIGFVGLGLITPLMGVFYVISQCIGAILGYGLIIALTPTSVMNLNTAGGMGQCCTLPHVDITALQAVAMEAFATGLLVLVVCACKDPRTVNNTDSLPLKFGVVILILCIAAGPYTGASLNPARSLGPALWHGVWRSHWVYWVGPCLGGLGAVVFYRVAYLKLLLEETSTLEQI